MAINLIEENEEDSDQDIAGFQKELIGVDSTHALFLLNNELRFEEGPDMWVVVRYSDFTGNIADRANGRLFLEKYTGIVSAHKEPNYNAVSIGVYRKDMMNFDAASLSAFLNDFRYMEEHGVVDQEIYKDVTMQSKETAWKDWLGSAYAAAVMLKFHGYFHDQLPDILMEMGKNGRLSGMFEEARQSGGIEWAEAPGGEMTTDVDGVVEYTATWMIRKWRERDLQQESLYLPEGKFSCIMAPAPDDLKDAVIKWGQMFVSEEIIYHDPEDSDDKGRENDIHVTVKFGLHETHPGPELLRIIEETQPFEIAIGPASLFENDEFDVVKFDVESNALRALNERISQLPCTDTYPEYNPHLTVAYVVKGTCNDLIGKPLLEPEDESGPRFIVKAVTFSSPDKKKTTLFLGKPNEDLSSNNLGEADQQRAAVTNKAPGKSTDDAEDRVAEPVSFKPIQESDWKVLEAAGIFSDLKG